MGNYADISSEISQPRCRHAWRADDETIHAAVSIGESSLVFEDPAVANATAVACAVAGAELTAMAAGASEGFGYGGTSSVTAVVLTRDRLIAALQHPAVTGALAMLDSQGGTPADLADAILEALNA